MWIAEFSESSNLWTHLALLGIPRSTPVWVSCNSQPTRSLWALLGLDIGGYNCRHESAPLKCISLVLCGSALGVISCLCRDREAFSMGKELIIVSSLETIHFDIWPQIRWDYPLNLSISISGGKETNKDSPSNCEWSGKSSNLKSGSLWLSEL